MKALVPDELIEKRIFLIRGQKIMFDRDLAELYGVKTAQLKRQVRRNIDRFPKDFMFKLTKKELENLRCQFGTSSWGGRRYLPYAFTEHGILMLSSVLNSDRAVQVNIQIMRTFTKLKRMISDHRELAKKIEKLENKFGLHDRKIKAIFEAVRQLLEEPPSGQRKIGFTAEKKRKEKTENENV